MLLDGSSRAAWRFLAQAADLVGSDGRKKRLPEGSPSCLLDQMTWDRNLTCARGIRSRLYLIVNRTPDLLKNVRKDTVEAMGALRVRGSLM
jgi:hypothetical protein